MTDSITLAIAIDAAPAKLGADAIRAQLAEIQAQAAATIGALKGVGLSAASPRTEAAAAPAAAATQRYFADTLSGSSKLIAAGRNVDEFADKMAALRLTPVDTLGTFFSGTLAGSSKLVQAGRNVETLIAKHNELATAARAAASAVSARPVIERGVSGLSAASSIEAPGAQALGAMPSAQARNGMASRVYEEEQAKRAAMARDAEVQAARNDMANARLAYSTGQISKADRDFAVTQGALNMALAKGTLTAEEHAVALESLGKKFDETAVSASKAASHINPLTPSSMREYLAGLRELATGDTARMPGTFLATLARFGGITPGVVATIGAGAAGLAAVLTPFVEYGRLATERRQFDQTALAFNYSTFATPELVDAAHGMARSGPFSRSQADIAVQQLMQQRTLSRGSAQEVMGAAGPLAEATGMTLPAATKYLGEAAQEGYAGIQKLEEAFGMLTPKEMDAAREMSEAGRQTDAFKLAIDALDRQMTSAVQASHTEAGTSFRDMVHAWSDALDAFVSSDAFKSTMDFLARSGTFVAQHLTPNAPPTATDTFSQTERALAAAQNAGYGWTGLSGKTALEASLEQQLWARRVGIMASGGRPAYAGSPTDIIGGGSYAVTAADVEDMVKASDLAADYKKRIAAASVAGPGADYASIQYEADQRFKAPGMERQKQAFVTGETGVVNAQRTAQSQLNANSLWNQESASEATTDAYQKSLAAGEQMRVQQDAQVAALQQGISYQLAYAEALNKATLEVDRQTEAEAKLVATYAYNDTYRTKEIAASAQSPAALAQQRSLDAIAKSFDVLRAKPGANIETLNTLQGQKQTEALRDSFAEAIESVNAAGARNRDQLASLNAPRGATPADTAANRAYAEFTQQYGSPYNGTFIAGNSQFQAALGKGAAGAADAARQKSMFESEQRVRTLAGADNFGSTAQDLSALNDLYVKGAISIQQYEAAQNKLYAEGLSGSRNWSDGAVGALRDYADAATNYGAQAGKLVNGTLSATNDYLTAMIDHTKTAKEAWHDFLESLLSDVTRVLTQTTVTGPMSQFLGGLLGTATGSPAQGGANGLGMFGAAGGAAANWLVNGSVGQWLGLGSGGVTLPGSTDSIASAIGGSSYVNSAADSGGFLGSLFGDLFADGGIMTPRGRVPLRAYSGGGIANTPQAAIFAENSIPEAYVPVPSGKIPVNLNMPAPMGGGGPTANIHVYAGSGVNMSDVHAAVMAGIRQAAPYIVNTSVKTSRHVAASDTYINARKGGQFASAFGNN